LGFGKAIPRRANLFTAEGVQGSGAKEREMGHGPAVMTLYEWFDPSDKGHIKAFHIATTTGRWPKGFIPDGVELGTLWSISNKIAEYYVAKVLEED
jgi:hypothetical protein